MVAFEGVRAAVRSVFGSVFRSALGSVVRRGRPASLALLAASAASWGFGASAAELTVPAGLAPPAGYRLVWADEFDTNGAVDTRRWTFDTERNKPGWHNNEKQYYAGPEGDNATVKDGRLLITARRHTPSDRPDWGGQRYTSARLLTRGKGQWTYGFFEVRAKMPCGLGTWPAIWTLGTGGRWPEDGELDIMEHMGQKPDRTSSAVHVATGHAGRAVWGATPVPTACSSFHRYQMHWTPDGVTFGVDGFAHLHYPRFDAGERAWPFDKPQFLLLNLAIGGDLGGPIDDRIFPVSFEVDYVRVYQRAEPASTR